MTTVWPRVDTVRLESLALGDERAWDHLFALYSGRIVAWGKALGLRGTEAEDVAEEVLAVARRRIRDCRLEQALAGWLYGLAWRKVRSTRRLNWFKRAVRSTDEAQEASAGATHGLRVDLTRWMSRLPFAQAEAVNMCWVEGQTLQEAATSLGVAKGTIASRLRLAREAYDKAESTEAQLAERLRGASQ